MDSAGPVNTRTAGQPTVSSGTTTFGIRGFNKAEDFARDWLCRMVGSASGPSGGYRAIHHPSAMGERQPA